MSGMLGGGAKCAERSGERKNRPELDFGSAEHGVSAHSFLECDRDD